MLFSWSKSKKGITVSEVLVAVLIIGVLCSIAVPNVVSYKKKLDQMELDTTAREIAFSVQNKLAGIKTAGLLSTENLGPVSRTGNTCTFSVPGYEGPLKDFALSTIEGSYSVYFDITTGDVRKVEYTKDGKSALYESDGSGTTVDFGNDELTMDPVLSVDNGNEIVLVAEIHDRTDRSGSEHLKDYFAYYPGFKYSVTLTGTNPAGGGVGTVTIPDSVVQSNTVSYDRNTYIESRITLPDEYLDQLDRNDFISASVRASFTAPSGKVINTDAAAARNIVSFHGMFGNGTIGNIVDVSCQRHLMNLSAYEPEDSGGIMVILTDNIVLGTGFAPVSNTLLFGDASLEGIAEFNGNDKVISGLNIYSDSIGEGGIFAHTNCSIKNVNIAQPKVTVTAVESSAGALCGTVYGGEIAGCDVTGGEIFGAKYAGGLIGKAGAADINGCVCSAEVQGDVYIGGFAGTCDGTHIEACEARGDVLCDSAVEGAYTGGFIGHMGASFVSPKGRNCFVTRCTAAGNVMSNDFAGGFVGCPEGSMDQCTSLGHVTNVEGEEDDEGFLGGFCAVWLNDIDELLCHFSKCSYLCKPGYNDTYKFNPEGVYTRKE